MHIPRSRAYSQLWRIVDGAVVDALEMHSDYLTPKGKRNARASITKRVTGSVLGFAEQSAKGRTGSRPAAETGSALPTRPSHRAAGLAVSIGRAVCVTAARLFRRAA